MSRKRREDGLGEHRTAFDKNRRRIFQSQKICALCGRPVDFSLKYPDPMSACVDHIIPIARGGHPSSIDNLQLAHLSCNNQKGDKLPGEGKNRSRFYADVEPEIIPNNILPHTFDWKNYKPDGE